MQSSTKKMNGDQPQKNHELPDILYIYSYVRERETGKQSQIYPYTLNNNNIFIYIYTRTRRIYLYIPRCIHTPHRTDHLKSRRPAEVASQTFAHIAF